MLGLLRKPGSGTDIKRYFDEAIGHFWAAELSQVYPTLNRMARDGLLTVTTEPSPKGPPRKVYSLTDAGRASLHEWLQGGPAMGTERLEWLGQVWCLAATPDHALPFFTELRAALAQRLATLEGIDAYWRREDPTYPDVADDEDFFPQLTLALGLRKLHAMVDWCDECIERITAREAKS